MQFDGRVLVLRWLDPEIAGRYGTSVYVRCSAETGPRHFLAQREFHSADYRGLQPIVEAFLASAGGDVTSACFDVAGPVIDGRAHLTNLPWNLQDWLTAQAAAGALEPACAMVERELIERAAE